MSWKGGFHWPDQVGTPNKTQRLIVPTAYDHLGWGTYPINLTSLTARAQEAGIAVPSWVSTYLPADPDTGTRRPPLKKSTLDNLWDFIQDLRTAEEATAYSGSIPSIQPNLDGQNVSRDWIAALLERFDYLYNSRTSPPSGYYGWWQGEKNGNSDPGIGETWEDAIEDIENDTCQWTNYGLLIPTEADECVVAGRVSGTYQIEVRRMCVQHTITASRYPDTPSDWTVSIWLDNYFNDWSRSGWEIELWGGDPVLESDGNSGYSFNATMIQRFSQAEIAAAWAGNKILWANVTSFIGTVSSEKTVTFWLIHRGGGSMTCTTGYPDSTYYPPYPTTSSWKKEGVALNHSHAIELHAYVLDPDDIGSNPI